MSSDPYNREFNRYDICEAYHVFATSWHGGGGIDFKGNPSGVDTNKRKRPHHHFDIESQLIGMNFAARPGLDYEHLTENGKLFYAGLVKRFGYFWPDDLPEVPDEFIGEIPSYYEYFGVEV